MHFFTMAKLNPACFGIIWERQRETRILPRVSIKIHFIKRWLLKCLRHVYEWYDRRHAHFIARRSKNTKCRYFPFKLIVRTSTRLIIWAATWENRPFAYTKTKTQISFAVTAKLISAFVFAILIVQSLYFLNPKFQVSSHLLWLYRSVCVRPVQKPRRPVFSQRGSIFRWSDH